MSLSSRLFRGDPQLEAAAVSDGAHITRGARGEHVRKIQMALSLLDGASLDPDGQYGPATAAAVLTYKQKRDIVNRSYESQADDIVGKMTIASLDQELTAAEAGSLAGPPQIQFLSPQLPALRSKSNGNIKLNLPLSPSFRKARVDGGVPKLDLPGFPFLPPKVFEMAVRATASFQVVNGVGGVVSVSDDRLAVLTDPPSPVVRPQFAVTKNPHPFQVFAKNPGTCALSVNGIRALADFASVFLRIRVPDDSRFHPGIQHNHLPCNKWEAIRNSPSQSVLSGETSGDQVGEDPFEVGANVANAIVRNSSTPQEVVAKVLSFRPGVGGLTPLARQHVDHYLFGGGRDFVEDENIRDWLLRDEGIRQKLAREVAANAKAGDSVVQGNFEFPQKAYRDDDFRLAFGAIDRVDFEADLVAGTLRVRFQDRYEWHPFFPGLYAPLAGDEARPTNGIHAAFVEMKNQGAADYWMKGEFTIGLIGP